MIIPNGELEHVCDVCDLPIEGNYILWKLPKRMMHFHPPCAHAFGGKLRSNVNRLYRLSEEKSQAVK